MLYQRQAWAKFRACLRLSAYVLFRLLALVLASVLRAWGADALGQSSADAVKRGFRMKRPHPEEHKQID